jgi:hypothetical protein
MPKKKTKKNPSKNIFKILIILIILAAAGFLVYSTITFQTSEQEKTGFFTCNQDNTICELSQHIHSYLDMNVCGEEVVFSKETGDLDKLHIHKDKNKLHWHSPLRVDPTTRMPLDASVLSLQSFLEQMEYELPATCPSNENPILTVIANGQIIENGLDYVWKDDDQIQIDYN